MPQRLFHFRAVLVSGVAVLACASPRTIPTSSPEPGASTRREDARPTFYAPSEVESQAVLLTPIEPAYPPEMRARGREGEVVVRVLVSADGSVAGAHLVEETDAAFSNAVTERILAARFAPAIREGRHVSSWVLVRIRFRIG